MAMSISGTDGITFPSGDTQGDAALGNGQTWQTLTGSRAFGTTYYNTTGKPIQVKVICTNSVSAGIHGAILSVDGIPVDWFNGVSPTGVASEKAALSAIIPHGSGYIVGVTQSTLSAWAELRD